MLELALGAQGTSVRVETLGSVIRIWVCMTTTSDQIEEVCCEAQLSNGQTKLALALWNSQYLDREFVHEGDIVLIRNASAAEAYRIFDQD